MSLYNELSKFMVDRFDLDEEIFDINFEGLKIKEQNEYRICFEHQSTNNKYFTQYQYVDHFSYNLEGVLFYSKKESYEMIKSVINEFFKKKQIILRNKLDQHNFEWKNYNDELFYYEQSKMNNMHNIGIGRYYNRL